MSNKLIYGHFAIEDFTDSRGVFHAKDSCCYVGSGSEARSKQMTQAGGNRSDVHENSKIFLYVKVLEQVSTEVAIERELYWYELISDSEANKLFNVNKPRAMREFKYEFFKDYLIADDTSPTGLRWIKPVLFGKNADKGDVAGTIKVKRKLHDSLHDYKSWVVCIKRKFYPAHIIAWVLQNKKDLPIGNIVMHLDNNATNNKAENLKIGTQLENRKSKTKQVRNKTGVEGVKLYFDTHCYSAQINDDSGKAIKVCFYFDTDNRKYKAKKTTKLYASQHLAFQAACNWRYKKCIQYGYDTSWYQLEMNNLPTP